MKASAVPPRRDGFTLVELLVALTIVLILMGLSISVAPAIYRQVKETQAKNAAMQISMAIDAYQNDYGRLPVEAASADVEITGAQLQDLYKILIASPRQDSVVQERNPRMQIYLDVRDTANGRNGLDEDYVYRDPWGNPYRIILDADADRQISEFPEPFDRDSSTDRPLRKRVAVFSNGDPSLDREEKLKAVTSW